MEWINTFHSIPITHAMKRWITQQTPAGNVRPRIYNLSPYFHLSHKTLLHLLSNGGSQQARATGITY